MPSESVLPPPSSSFPVSNVFSKCPSCGSNNDNANHLLEKIDEDCGSCRSDRASSTMGNDDVTTMTDETKEDTNVSSIGLGLQGVSINTNPSSVSTSSPSLEPDGNIQSSSPSSSPPTNTDTIQDRYPITPSSSTSLPSPTNAFQPSSLPKEPTQPWSAAPSIPSLAVNQGSASSVPPIKEEITSDTKVKKGDEPEITASGRPIYRVGGENEPYNRYLELEDSRVGTSSRGALYVGSVFRGTQTSGRSAYDVEVKFMEVNIPESSVSGYLSISHLTDTHPHLTTFFTGEIIGMKYPFITGSRYGATEHDDMRHWGRFEQFRRPQTRADMIRPELFLRDPMPDRTQILRGEKKGKERDFIFLRIKERFLVPDHTVRDISGASFAGFYFAMIDLNPTSSDIPQSPSSPTIPKPPLSPTMNRSTSPQNQYFPTVSPTLNRRQSSSGPPPPAPSSGIISSPTATRRTSMSGNGGSGAGAGVGAGGPRSPSMDKTARKRRESTTKALSEREGPREATIRGYYFHSLNQEPFQELFLTHVPNRSMSVFELR